MSIAITAPLANGDLWDPLEKEATGEDVVELICGDDLRPAPTGVVIRLRTDSGKLIEIRIPNSTSKASVRVDGVLV